MAKMNPMVSMKMDAEAPGERAYDAVVPSMIEKQEYPWGLQLTLTHKELEKMDLDPADAVIGGMIHLHAMARITSVSMDQGTNGKSCCIRLQIEDMCVESEDEENEEEDAGEDDRMARRRKLYDRE